MYLLAAGEVMWFAYFPFELVTFLFADPIRGGFEVSD